MSEMLFLSSLEVQALLDLDELRHALAEAFRALSGGDASVPARTAAVASNGLLAAMPGFLHGVGMGAKLVSVFPHNHEAGLPSHQALICLFDPDNGSPLAMMDGGYITAVRTAAASAVAADILSRPEAAVLAILGAGVQGQAHLEAMPRIRDFTEVRVASRSKPHADRIASNYEYARSVASFEEAVTGADIVGCCTDSSDPIISRSWLKPGVHVCSVGMGCELDGATVTDGDVFVEWRGAAMHPPPAGAIELQGVGGASVTEIGEVLSGLRPGRERDDQITVYKSTGHAAEDLAAARLVYDRAIERGVGLGLNFS